MAKKKFVCHIPDMSTKVTPHPIPAPSAGFLVGIYGGCVRPEKGWMHNPNSNTYIIVYSTVMVVIVATLLAVASLSLQKRQAENELQEKKSNILQSLGYSPDENPQEFDRALANFDNQVKSFVLDADGVKTETPSKEVFAMLATDQNIRDNYDAKRHILFQTEDGRVVIPLIGMGLWGDIWGYVALEKDMDTVSGIVMAHKGETPGLGAEIATPKFQAHFAGKKLFKSGEFVSVSLRKGGAKDPEHEGRWYFGRYEHLGRRDGHAPRLPVGLPALLRKSASGRSTVGTRCRERGCRFGSV